MSMLSKSEKIATLRNDQGLVSFLHRKRPFVLGFRSATQCRHVHYNMNPVKPNMRLHLCSNLPPIHVNELVLEAAEMFEQPINNVYMDLHAIWMLDKKGVLKSYQQELCEHLSFTMQLSEEDDASLLTMPLSKNVGVVLPHEIAMENEKLLVFRACVVYPELRPTDYVRMFGDQCLDS